MRFLSRFVVCAVALVATARFGEAQTPASPNVIYACVGDLAQFVRIVSGPNKCVAGEKIVEWNIVGVAGPQGPQGPMGLSGPAGPAGAVGPVGPSGAPGAPGAQGVAGPVGPAGANGAAGPAGPAGANGAVGPIGPAGAPGAVGPMGPAGAPGAVGPMGAIGPMGPAGVAGAVGPAGATGAAGPAGPSGPTGPAGPQGPAGSTTLPANLQALSTLLTVDPNAQYNGRFTDGNGSGGCTLGDILLSANRYQLGNYAPADGSLIQIATNPALFSLLGTRFGGDGLKTYALPNLTAATPSGMYFSICVQGVFPPQN